MYLDILIFAIIAAFLVYRLNAVLGTRRGQERPRQNPFADDAASAANPLKAPESPMPVSGRVSSQQGADLKQFIDPEANKDGRVESGLEEIAAGDSSFEVARFMAGAKYAFENVVAAYNKGDRAVLRPLLSPKLYDDFDVSIKMREERGHKVKTDIHRIKAMCIVEAHLGGTMAYITIDYDVEETTVTRDGSGAVVEGSPDHISSVEDVWTFTRDIRSSDPNWMLIETRGVEK